MSVDSLQWQTLGIDASLGGPASALGQAYLVSSAVSDCDDSAHRI